MKEFLNPRVVRVLLVLSVLFILVMNMFALCDHDALSYAYAGQQTPLIGDCEHIRTLWDIVRQQYRDYMATYGNGRVIVHSIVALFAGFELYFAFDVINTFMWFLLVYMLMRVAGFHRINCQGFLVASLLIWLFMWYGEYTLNEAFAVNYLWCAVLTLAVAWLWRHGKRFRFLPVFFVFGWSQECFVLPFICSVVGGWGIRSICQKKLMMNRYRLVAFFLICCGACFLCCGPAAGGRSQEIRSSILKNISTIIPSIALLIWPCVVAFLLCFLLWKYRHHYKSYFNATLEYWLFLGSAISMCLLINQGIVRLSVPWMVAASLLVMKSRARFKFARSVVALCGISFVVLVFSTVGQFLVGKNIQHMLSVYADSKNNLTWRKNVVLGPLYYRCRNVEYRSLHWALFRLDCKKEADPIVVTRDLYEGLTSKYSDFLKKLRPSVLPMFWEYGDSRAVLICLDKELLSKKNIDRANDEISLRQKRIASKWRLGRMSLMFPNEDTVVRIPDGMQEIDFITGEKIWIFGKN